MNKAWAALAVAAVAFAACSSPSHTESLNTPVATSIITPEGAYVTLPMGDPTNPLDTFWQLLVRPSGSPRWVNQVTATGVATNGGLVLAGGGGSVLAAPLPSNLLKFTPLIATSTSGRSWQPKAPLSATVAAYPYSITQGAQGILAITGAGEEVLRLPEGESNWGSEVTLSQLDQSASACRPSAITAVAFSGGQLIVGASCRKDGSSGIVVDTGSTWDASGPTVTRGERSSVLGLRATGDGLAALLQVTSRNGTALMTAGESAGQWTTGPALNLDGQLLSYGPAPGDGWFALIRERSGDLKLATSEAIEGDAWQFLPTPPPGTETLAFGTTDQGSADAFTVDSTGTVLTIWGLPAGSNRWIKTQTLEVPIQTGSSG